MNRRQRLINTLQGKPVDRPAVSFYELNGLDENPADPDPYNIYNDPSWLPLIELTRDYTDRIVMRSVPFVNTPADPTVELAQTQVFLAHGSRYTRCTIQAPGRRLSSLTRRDPPVNTTWTIEPLLKDVDDLKAWLSLPTPVCGGVPDTRPVLEAEAALGDTGIVMIDTADPLCQAAALFALETYCVMALTEPVLFRTLLERLAERLLPQIEAIAQALPGRLWRIYGPEYASPPFLPPLLFREYAVNYDTLLVESIHRYDGYARIHSHGKLKAILDLIAHTGCDGLDPIEPPPQGDVSLAFVRQRYGRAWVLFGNLEVSDIENLPTSLFEARVRQALKEGMAGEGRGFVLMPSACPYGRQLSPLALANYRKIIEIVDRTQL